MSDNKQFVFPELIGNDRLKQSLTEKFAAGLSAHAYILEGPAGSGKHVAAQQIAATVLCERKDEPGVTPPCGTCTACRRVKKGVSVDVMAVSTEKATISVDQIREIRSTLFIAPNDGDMKFYIIEQAELMTPNAQNALLLSLEEPPSYVMFLLLTTDSTLLLPTIRSRAPVIRMERFDAPFLEETLRRVINDPDPDRLRAAARMADGTIGQALSLYENDKEELKHYDTARELVSVLLDGRRSDAIVFTSSRLPRERRDVREVLSLSRRAVRDLIAQKKNAPLLFYEDGNATPAAARSVSVRQLVRLSDRLAQAENDIAANCSANTVMTALVMNSPIGKN